ncbi:MAG: alkaline phosphatase D family protein [Halieaceae bacterium]|jgi:alkaline phosphatase D|nr:alkaline phosphatase D family protein [Halieaceae bacterium]
MSDRDSKMPPIDRRRVLKGLAAGSLLPLLGGNLLGCSDSDDTFNPDPGVAASFRHGVASGDALDNSVIIWTRATPVTPGLVRIRWEVASDEAFDSIVASGEGTTTAEVDYTAKVDVGGLDAGTTYFYRFLVQEVASPVGRTRTLPTGSVAATSFAVVSCSNYPAGFFNVYREIADRDVDAVLHLGDYIYEYGIDGYASDRAEEFGRVSEPGTEILSLDDYRTRYAQYRSDADLQACHAAHPFYVVWDDHEITNDTWRDGAENHQPDTEGDFDERVAVALQAWYEWSPIRPPSSNREVIYRQFQFGDLVDLLMLDTRLIGRDQQLSYGDYLNGDMLDIDSARAAINDPTRQLLGEDQNAWLKDRLTNSTTTWQALGQQVLVGRYNLPASILLALDPSFGGSLQDGIAAVLASVAAKNTPEDQRTPEQQALLDSAIPYNLDAWDGYGFNRDDLLTHAASVDAKLVTLAGDTHNAWAAQLTDTQGNPVGVEFATASVTSPGLEGVLGADAAALFEGPIVTLIDDLQYTNLSDRGWMEVTFTPTAATADWYFVSNVDSTTYTLMENRAASRSVSVNDLQLG